MKFLSPLISQNLRISALCSTPGAELELDTGDRSHVFIKQYRINYNLRNHVDVQVKEWLSDGVIRVVKEFTHWNTPIVIVPKRELCGTIKGWRMCLDLRHLNSIIKSVNYPLPLIKDVLESLSNSVVHSRLDLKSSFNQIRLKETDQIKTTFTWNGTQYCFVGVPFGIKSISSVFQKIMMSILAHLPFVKIFIDDLIIHSSDKELHMNHLANVFDILNSHNLKVNIKKCLFAKSRIVVLGYRISRDGIKLAKEKLLVMENWSPPSTHKQFLSHLGFFNYFRDLVPLYSKITEPLDRLRSSQNIQLDWNSQHAQIYQTLKEILLSDIMLHYPNFKPFCVATDASGNGI